MALFPRPFRGTRLEPSGVLVTRTSSVLVVLGCDDVGSEVVRSLEVLGGIEEEGSLLKLKAGSSPSVNTG
jgi:hypothetical protein